MASLGAFSIYRLVAAVTVSEPAPPLPIDMLGSSTYRDVIIGIV